MPDQVETSAIQVLDSLYHLPMNFHTIPPNLGSPQKKSYQQYSHDTWVFFIFEELKMELYLKP